VSQSLLTSAVAVLILGAGSQSRADTITITGGSAGFDEGDPPGFHLIFDEGELFGGFFLGGMTFNFPVNSPINCLFPSCQPGDTVSLAAEWKQQSTIPGSAIINAQEFQPFYDLSFSFHAAAATLPPLTDGVQVNVPFTMDGTIALFLDPARTTPLLSGTIAGQGTANAEFRPFEGGWAFVSHDYFFEPAAAPVPEPGTLTLLVTGAVGILLQRKRAASHRPVRSR
jgi:hypothetical protein